MRVLPVFAEALESRTLLSASPSAALRRDQLQVQLDLLQFKLDAIGNYSTLLTDVAAIHADSLSTATTVAPLVKHMKVDIKALDAALLADRLAEKANVLADESVITTDELQVLKDKGNSAALTADHTKLRNDRIQMQNDEVAGLNARVTTRQNGYNTVFADGQAIVAAAETDPHASAQLTADLTKWTSDKNKAITLISADLQKIITDRTALIADLTALQPL